MSVACVCVWLASRFVKAKSKPLVYISENRQLWKVWKAGAFIPSMNGQVLT